METLCIILGRAGSKGLKNKNSILLNHKMMVGWTIDHAQNSQSLTDIVVSTDCPVIQAYCLDHQIDCIDRPDELAGDLATVDSAARHALKATEQAKDKTYDAAVILYANVPIRPADLTDQAIEKLIATNCDSVQSVSPVGKNHPYWMKTLDGDQNDQLMMYQENQVYRRQELPDVFMLDGGIIAVTRKSLMLQTPNEPHAFLGEDRRAIITKEDAVVDIDGPADLAKAKAILETQNADETSAGFGIGLRWLGRTVEPFSTYILAEIGVNHDGDINKAIELIEMAKEAGADGVKFQLFEAGKLLSDDAILASYQKEAGQTDPYEMLDQLQLGLEDLLEAKAKAHELGLGFIVSCFSVELMQTMADLGVDAVKFASPDLVNKPLIEQGAQLGVPMIFSVGASDAIEQYEALSYALSLSDQVAVMGCVSNYPVAREDASLGQIGNLKARFNLPVGYSDHTTDVFTGMLAVAGGATIVEKHITYDQNAVGPDHRASFAFEEFRKYCEHIRRIEGMMGDKQGGVLACENDVRAVSRQSVCTLKDLPAGHLITAQDITVKRPGTGIPAKHLKNIIGQKTTHEVKANRILMQTDVTQE